MSPRFHRSLPARRSAASQRGRLPLLWLTALGLVGALLLPTLSAAWMLPNWRQLAPGERHALGVVLGLQTLGMLAVLIGVWRWRVAHTLQRLTLQAQALAGGSTPLRRRAPQIASADGALGALGEHLQQAQQRISGLVEALESRHREMHRMAMYDALTGLPNRRLFRDLFDHAAASAQRRGRPMALLFIDLDHFKAVNDRFGHPAGDQLLLCISQRLRETVRGSDLVGRLGGDEFVALLPDTVQQEAIAHTALRLIQAIEAPVPLDSEGAQGQVSASIGVARFPRDGNDFDTLLDHADQAMYRAKTLGRGRFALFQPLLDQDDERLAEGADGELLHALDHGELQLHYQPVVDTGAGCAVGAEALMRWQHPRDGLISPARFMPRAEESGQGQALSRSTLALACSQLAQWKQMGLRPGLLTINVSSRQFHHPDFLDELQAALDRHQIARGELAIELTEDALVEDPERTLERLTQLRQRGVALVIDDFGAGTLSLARLGELRPAMIKLDPLFVQRLPGDERARALVAGIAALARSLAIALVAEGVETEAQRDALAELGCPLQQGFLFARPQPALPEPAWPLLGGPGTATQGANDSQLGELMPLDTLHARHVAH